MAQEPIINRPVAIRSSHSGHGNETLHLNINDYPGEEPAFVLVHGLSSNSRTWDAVASILTEAGHRVVTVDQRGHGLSDKVDHGYDFATVAEDLRLLLETLGLHKPILVGQSWGGNVVLAFGVLYPELIRGLAFVDGGYIDLQMRPNATWERIERDLHPPKLVGTPRSILKERIKSFHPDWDEVGIEGTLANFETLPDETIRPWLTLPRHMTILRALWEQRPSELYPQIATPVLICAAQKGAEPEKIKHAQVDAAMSGLPTAQVEWFTETDHDIHIHRPARLSDLFLRTLKNGIWS